MYIGVDYYPEHWPQSRWKTDVRLMRKAGFNVVRLAEFAWSKMEPEEGRFEFEWLDEILGLLRREGISAILGTPTAAMPAWAPRRYPEVMAEQADGTRQTWGIRKNNCFSSGTYRLLSERITRAMGEHFTATPNVIGWQTDNEFGAPVCRCGSCLATFHDWLRTRYGSLQELNRAWGTHFWGHTFGEWSEIPFPVNPQGHNPSACLDWARFNSWLNVRFQHDQVRILRRTCPKHFVTHNLMGLFKELDYYDLAKDLDFVSWDNYPVWGAPDMRYDASLAADLMRGIKGRNFWIMEQTAGPGGWASIARNPRPGEIRAVAHQQVAHGADGMVWFRWRTCTAGREQYWHGLLGHDGKPGRRYREAARTASELKKLAPVLAGTTVDARVAIIYDYDSIWAQDYQPGYAEGAAQNAIRRYHRALFRAGVNVDLVPPSADLSRYRAVFAPHLFVMPDELARRLDAWVRQGGVLVADIRTGVKDGTNLCHDRTLPGLLGPAMGIRIDEYEGLTGQIAYEATGTDAFPGTFSGSQYADWVIPERAEKLVGYTPWHMAPYAALTRNAHGKGAGWYVGTVMKEDAFYDQLIDGVLADARLRPTLRPPAGVEMSVRRGGGRRILFVVNHTEERKSVPVPAGKRELLAGRRTGGTLDLDRHGVAVIEL